MAKNRKLTLSETRSLTLASVSEEINKYLYKKDKKTLRKRIVKSDKKLKKLGEETETEFLRQIQNQIRAIQTAERGWLKVGGLVTDDTARKEAKYTQESIVQEFEKTHKATLAFTYVTVTQLQNQVAEFKKNHAHFTHLPGLMEHLESSFDATIKGVKEQAELKTIEIPIKRKIDQVHGVEKEEKNLTSILKVETVELNHPIIRVLRKLEHKVNNFLKQDDRQTDLNLKLTNKQRKFFEDILQEFKDRISKLAMIYQEWHKKNPQPFDSSEARKDPNFVNFMQTVYVNVIELNGLINRQGNYSLSEELIVELQKIKEAIKSQFDINEQINNDQIKIQKFQLKNIPIEDVLKKFVTVVHGRYAPFHQGLDPLFGGSPDGVCFGHVMEWSNSIKEFGSSISQPHLDNATAKFQNEQNKFRDKGILKDEYKGYQEFKEAMVAIIKKLSDSKLYELHHYSEHGHTMGLRLIPNSDPNKVEIEFFDPNFGIFIFNKNSIEGLDWLSQFVFANYCMKSEGIIQLFELGDQPLSAKSTIPSFSELSKAENKEACARSSNATIYQELKINPLVAQPEINIKPKNTADQKLGEDSSASPVIQNQNTKKSSFRP